MPDIQLRDVTKTYDLGEVKVEALRGVSFEVAEGEIFGLLGPNGAGKTTLLSIVSCLLEADAGEARIHGKIVNLADKEMRRHIGTKEQVVVGR